MDEATRLKVSLARKGKGHHAKQFQKGMIPWNKGNLSKLTKEQHKIAGSKGALSRWEGHIKQIKSRPYVLYAKIWRKNHPEKVRFTKQRRRAREMQAEGSHTLEQWEALKRVYGFMCSCCKKQEPEIKLSEDHIIPLSRGGTDYITNIQPLCCSCNSRKSVKIVDYREKMLVLSSGEMF